jgi:hypothetical protein
MQTHPHHFTNDLCDFIAVTVWLALVIGTLALACIVLWIVAGGPS